MSPERLRSIVPMFGGGDRYVETLDAILEYVEKNHPTTDELVGWHRGTFENVSSRESIMRRIDYLEDVGFLEGEDGKWDLGPYGDRYIPDYEITTLLEIMCERNVGLRSLLYALSVGPMSIEEISDQQLDTHADLGWTPGETDMALQRVNWLRSMGLMEKRESEYELTEKGQAFVDDAVDAWAGSDWTASEDTDTFTAAMYETTTQSRALDPEFRVTVLTRYDHTCPLSGVDHPGLLDVVHVLPWSSHPDVRSDLSNVLALSKTHHAAFDREMFTIDQQYRLQVNPDFETQSALLEETIVEQSGEPVDIPENFLNAGYLGQYNASLSWV